MKKLKKEKPIPEDVHCKVCGLERRYTRILQQYDVRGCNIPALEITKNCETHFDTICTECKQAILDHVWNSVIKHKPVKNKFGLLFDINKDIDAFIAANYADFNDIAEEYRHIANVTVGFDNILHSIAKRTVELNDEYPIIPSYAAILRTITEINNDRLSLDNDQTTPTTDRVKVLLDEEITEENSNTIFDDENVAKLMQDVPGVRFMTVSIEPETFYESNVEIRFSFVALNMTTYQKAMSEKNATSVINPSKKGKHNNTPLNDAFGTDTDLGNFKID